MSNTRKQEIKCFILFTAVFLFGIVLIAHEKLDEILLLVILLFVIAYLAMGMLLEYRAIREEESKPVEIEMVMIHSSDICTICLEPCLNGVEIECGHIFHKKCIEKWVALNKTCPNCRVSV